MTRHVASTRDFPMTYSQAHPYVEVSPAFRGRPCEARMPVMAPLPVAGAGGQPYMGMDPSAPVTWVRPWNPQPGMVARLNFDGAKRQGDTPMGGTWRNPMRDRADVRPRRRFGRRV
jgi:hypothetical protein